VHLTRWRRCWEYVYNWESIESRCCAFSIENLKRSEVEVNALVDLAETMLLELTKHGYVLIDPSASSSSFLPADVRPNLVKSWISMVEGVTGEPPTGRSYHPGDDQEQ